MREENPFEVRVERERQCIHILMRGRWTHADFDGFAAALRTAEKEMGRFEGTTFALTDGSQFEMQDLTVAERFLPMLRSFALDSRRRSAVVVPPGALSKMQARPAGEIVNARFFLAIEAATDWLFSDEA